MAAHVHTVRHRPRLRIVDLDLRHHALVLVLGNVAVVHETADDDRVDKRHPDFDFAMNRHVDGVLQAQKLHRLLIDAQDLERHLVDVEHMQLLGRIADGPLLDGPQRHFDVHTRRIERLVVDEEELGSQVFRERNKSASVDAVARNGLLCRRVHGQFAEGLRCGRRLVPRIGNDGRGVR